MENLNYWSRTFWKHVVSDFSALAGLPVYLIITVYMISMDSFYTLYSVIIISVIAYILKFFYFSPRPLVKKTKFSTLAERLEMSSFPSLHSARAGILSLLFLNTIYFIPSIIITLFIGYTRVALKKHHTIDVIAGLILGYSVGFLVI